MSERMRALAILPHPDDETCFLGGTLAKLSAEGVETQLLVLTSGGAGKITIHKGETVVGSRPAEGAEIQGLEQQREQECLEAAEVLGIQKVEFLKIPDQGVNEQQWPRIKNKIQEINPHLILTFNEAGSTAHPDHSWTSLLTFYAVTALLSEQAQHDFSEQLNFLNLLMYTLPSAVQWFDKHGEILSADRITVDVRRQKPLKKQAAAKHKTQKHLIQFFEKQGLLDVDEEYFLNPINNDGTAVRIDGMPRPDTVYVGSYLGLFSEIEERCRRIEAYIQSFQAESITTVKLAQSA